MNIRDIIRAWRDREFREGLSSEEMAKLPANPAGEILLTEEDMASVEGGSNNGCGYTYTPTIDLACQK
jgi:mersacidin/lichenicidin family type 2 lantibiotic